MGRSSHEIVRAYFAGMSTGNVPSDVLAENLTTWTTSSGAHSPGRAGYQASIKGLQSLFPGGLAYTVDAITAEDDRAAAEVRARGTLRNGDLYENTYVFIFRFRDGQIATIAEHFNSLVVNQKIVPLYKAG